jgi:hypothetical protein
MRQRILVVLASFVLQTPCALADDVPAFRNPAILENVDEIELLSVTSEKGVRMGSVEATSRVKDKDVPGIVALWRSQTIYDQSPAACHDPSFAIKFYSKGKVTLFASVCWGCSNIDFMIPVAEAWAGFEGKSPAGQELLSLFKSAFPNKHVLE